MGTTASDECSEPCAEALDRERQTFREVGKLNGLPTPPKSQIVREKADKLITFTSIDFCDSNIMSCDTMSLPILIELARPTTVAAIDRELICNLCISPSTLYRRGVVPGEDVNWIFSYIIIVYIFPPLSSSPAPPFIFPRPVVFSPPFVRWLMIRSANWFFVFSPNIRKST